MYTCINNNNKKSNGSDIKEKKVTSAIELEGGGVKALPL